MKLGVEVGLGPGHIVLDGDPAPRSLSPKMGAQPPFSAHVLWPNGRPKICLYIGHNYTGAYSHKKQCPHSSGNQVLTSGGIPVEILCDPFSSRDV